MIEEIKKFLSDYWFLILIIFIGSMYFLSDIRKINKKYNCDFDIVLNDWKQSELDLLKAKQKLIEEANSPPKGSPILKQEIEDARKDLEKREYLKEADIREAEKMIDIDKRFKEFQVQYNISRQKEVNSCLQFINEKYTL